MDDKHENICYSSTATHTPLCYFNTESVLRPTIIKQQVVVSSSAVFSTTHNRLRDKASCYNPETPTILKHSGRVVPKTYKHDK